MSKIKQLQNFSENKTPKNRKKLDTKYVNMKLYNITDLHIAFPSPYNSPQVTKLKTHFFGGKTSGWWRSASNYGSKFARLFDLVIRVLVVEVKDSLRL